MPDATGRFDVSNATIVTGMQAWKMSLPADSNPGNVGAIIITTNEILVPMLLLLRHYRTLPAATAIAAAT